MKAGSSSRLFSPRIAKRLLYSDASTRDRSSWNAKSGFFPKRSRETSSVRSSRSRKANAHIPFRRGIALSPQRIKDWSSTSVSLRVRKTQPRPSSSRRSST